MMLDRIAVATGGVVIAAAPYDFLAFEIYDAVSFVLSKPKGITATEFCKKFTRNGRKMLKGLIARNFLAVDAKKLITATQTGIEFVKERDAKRANNAKKLKDAKPSTAITGPLTKARMAGILGSIPEAASTGTRPTKTALNRKYGARAVDKLLTLKYIVLDGPNVSRTSAGSKFLKETGTQVHAADIEQKPNGQRERNELSLHIGKAIKAAGLSWPADKNAKSHGWEAYSSLARVSMSGTFNDDIVSIRASFTGSTYFVVLNYEGQELEVIRSEPGAPAGVSIIEFFLDRLPQILKTMKKHVSRHGNPTGIHASTDSHAKIITTLTTGVRGLKRDNIEIETQGHAVNNCAVIVTTGKHTYTLYSQSNSGKLELGLDIDDNDSKYEVLDIPVDREGRNCEAGLVAAAPAFAGLIRQAETTDVDPRKLIAVAIPTIANQILKHIKS